MNWSVKLAGTVGTGGEGGVIAFSPCCDQCEQPTGYGFILANVGLKKHALSQWSRRLEWVGIRLERVKVVGKKERTKPNADS